MMILKILRNSVGGLIAGGSYIFAPKVIKRSADEQKLVDKQTQNLELYQFFACPFCIKTRRTMRKLNLNITTKSVSDGEVGRDELLQGGGKIQAPCLKITNGDEVEWLYESDLIAAYLEDKFGS